MSNQNSRKENQFTVMNGLDWGLDPEPATYKLMNIVKAIAGGLNAIALGVLLKDTF